MAGGAEAAPAKRTPEELQALRQVVINALGLKLAPGEAPDSLVTLTEMPFAVEPLAQQAQQVQSEGRWIGRLDAGRRWVGLGAAALVFLLFLRLLSRQKPEPVPVEVLTLPPDVAARSLPSSGNITPEMVNELIRQKPANVGAALRNWVSADNN